MPADFDRWLDLLLTANVLKTTPRTGWHLRGVPRPEDVAAHSWGTAMVALTLAEMSGEDLDRGRVLSMAVLHDLAEAEVSDIPRLAVRFLPSGAKNDAEARALAEMLDGLPLAAGWTALLDEYKTEASPEARLVRDADRLEFLLQAFVYRETTGNRRLEQIRQVYAERDFATAAAQTLADLILARWPDASDG
jgi:putative hydrolase of HD superfamily